ncbi:MAG: 2-dehydro-3-deoxy-6-phosphogalactonate aldolase, partial [Brevundimonas sp.]
ALVGAGTVLEVDMVRAVSEAGGQLVVSPNTDPDVIRATRDAGLISAPGFLTPTEAFLALRAGADILKLFPGEFAGPGVLRAMRAVLPPAARVYAVGGVQAETVGPWLAAGASGFGIGSRIFSPGMSPEDVRRRASRFMAELKAQLASQAGGQA